MRIVLLPGMDGTGLLFSSFVSALGDGFEATVVEYPATAAADYAELERIARSSIPADEPFILLAESFSGPIAISVAASDPPGLRGLVLCCSFARNPVPFLAALRPLIGLVPLTIIPAFLLSPLIFGGFSTGALRSEFARALAHVSNSALRARIKAILQVDVSAKLQNLSVPILYLRASADRLVPRDASEHVRSLAPESQVFELQGPHLLLQAMPTAAAAIVRDFAHNL